LLIAIAADFQFEKTYYWHRDSMCSEQPKKGWPASWGKNTDFVMDTGHPYGFALVGVRCEAMRLFIFYGFFSKGILREAANVQHQIRSTIFFS
jgi:hypothetical protein